MSLERRPGWRRGVRTGARVTMIMAVCLPLFAVTGAVAGAGMLLFGDLPGTVPEERPRIQAMPSTVYDGDGNQIGEFREFDLTLEMTPEDVPRVLKDAAVAAEDGRFWQHEGFDVEGLARAALANYREGDTVQGGSTITQQLIRERYLTRDQTVERKLNEIILAARFERDLAADLGSELEAKEEILFEYLDTVYFGAGAYGAAAAAETYFRKPVSELNLSEAATMAGVIPAPSRFSPREDLNTSEERRRTVLRRMLDEGFVTQEEYDDAIGQTLWPASQGDPPGPATVVHPPPLADSATYPYFVDYVRSYLLERYGPETVYRGGLEIHTTIDPELQGLAEAAVGGTLDGTEPPLEMSLVSVEPSTGFVKTLVGGRDFEDSQVNLALGGVYGMQPGSVFKVFTAAKALEEGMGPDTAYDSPSVLQIPGCGGTCSIQGGPGGSVDMARAVSSSVNTYFVQLIMDLGPDEVAELANRMGVSRITLDQEYNVGLTLGAFEVSPLDMAASFAVFANRGIRNDATPVAYVERHDGSMLEDNREREGVQAIHQGVADHSTEMMLGVVEGGTGTGASIGRPVAGKTGTSQANRDAWFAGYTPQLATAVWMGHRDEPQSLYNIQGYGQVFGGGLPASTFANFMGPAHEGLEVEEFPEPGMLPAPGGGERRIPLGAGVPALPRDCGGPCVQLNEPAQAPPGQPDDDDAEPDDGNGDAPDGEPDAQPQQGPDAPTQPQQGGQPNQGQGPQQPQQSPTTLQPLATLPDQDGDL